MGALESFDLLRFGIIRQFELPGRMREEKLGLLAENLKSVSDLTCHSMNKNIVLKWR